MKKRTRGALGERQIMLERLAFTSITVAVASSVASAAVAESEPVHSDSESFGVEEATTSQVVPSGSTIAFRASGFAPGSLVVVRGITGDGFATPMRRLLCDDDGNATVSLVRHRPGELVLTASGVAPNRRPLTRSIRFTVVEPQPSTEPTPSPEDTEVQATTLRGTQANNPAGLAGQSQTIDIEEQTTSASTQTANSAGIAAPTSASASAWAGVGAAGIAGAVMAISVVRRRTNVIRAR